MSEGDWSFLMLGVVLGSVGALLLRVVIREAIALFRDLALLREILYGDEDKEDQGGRRP
jgi:hypothetical protein